MKKWFALLCCLLLPLTALGDSFRMPPPSEAAQGVEVTSEYVSFYCPVSQPGSVMLTIWDGWNQMVYQRSFGTCTDSFYTEDIFLRLEGNRTTYTVALETPDGSWNIPVTRLPARQIGCSGCTLGYPLSALNGGNTWRCATLLSNIPGSCVQVPLCVDGALQAGHAQLCIEGDALTVHLSPASGVTVESSEVQVATHAAGVTALGSRNFAGTSGMVETPIVLGGAPVVAVYVRLSLSYDPAALLPVTTFVLPGQDALWQQMQQQTPNEALG